MQDKNTPAFPLEMVYTQENEKFNGMSLRDYFAAKAMQRFLDEVSSKSDQEWFDQIAKNAYRMANEMMKARTE